MADNYCVVLTCIDHNASLFMPAVLATEGLEKDVDAAYNAIPKAEHGYAAEHDIEWVLEKRESREEDDTNGTIWNAETLTREEAQSFLDEWTGETLYEAETRARRFHLTLYGGRQQPEKPSVQCRSETDDRE